MTNFGSSISLAIEEMRDLSRQVGRVPTSRLVLELSGEQLEEFFLECRQSRKKFLSASHREA